MNKHNSFMKIGCYNDIINAISKTNLNIKPRISFKGTVKVHGTNLGIIQMNNQIWCQSRARIITPLDDNAGSAFFITQRLEIFNDFFNKIRQYLNLTGDIPVGIFGEFFGENIQKTVGVKDVAKSFVVFCVKIIDFNDDTKSNYMFNDYDIKYIKSPENKIYNIHDFKTFDIYIDFNNIKDIAIKQNELIDISMQIGNECPVAKQLLQDKINNGAVFDSLIGEGAVWTGYYNGELLIFKVKDDRHSKTKINKLKNVTIDQINNLQADMSKIIPIWRLEQMLEKTFDFMNGGVFDRTKIKDFINNVLQDILDEELLFFKENNLSINDVKKYVSDICRKYYFEQEHNFNNGIN